MQAFWMHYERHLGILDPNQRPFPDFLIIGPPRTGTTWLADVLRSVKGIYVPAEKELHYFDYNWKYQTVSEYLGNFAGHESDVKGEATPTYALLPREVIALITRINPELKIVFLLRDPVERAWSQLKHCRRCREDTFRHAGTNDRHDAAQLVTHLLSDYNRAGNDYPAILSRWAEYLPDSAIFVDYFESAVTQPLAFFARLVRFLGVPEPEDWEEGNPGEARNVGDSEAMPANIRDLLCAMYAPSVVEIAGEMRRRFGLVCPWPEERKREFQWPVQLGEIIEGSEVSFDGTWLTARDARNRDEIARGKYLEDLTAIARNAGYTEKEPEVLTVASAQRTITRGLSWVGEPPDEARLSQRLMSLLDSINLDRLALLQSEWFSLQRDWTQRSVRIEELQSELAARDVSIAGIHRDLVETGLGVDRLHHDWDARGLRIRELEIDLAARDKTVERLQDQLVKRSSEIVQLSDDWSARSARITELESTLTARETTVEGLQNQLVEKSAEISQLHNDWSGRGARIEELEIEVAARDRNVEGLQNQLAQKSSEILQLHEDWSARGARIEELQNALAARDDTIESVQCKLAEERTELGRLRDDWVARAAQMSELQTELSRSERRREYLTSALAETHRNIEELVSELSRLKSTLLFRFYRLIEKRLGR